ncbi:hypothetical protein C7293_04910 [filamentous cyanobacterium CCT1]|nr:hypothetical protein C7293_04910 [filamentous cyanobacterium CCT1]PSN81057.1 hypothetical protein C8B47_03355 [filamentous cyanobacterium CCP4]
MIGELKPYLTYKDSGVPWLGEVPKHWALVRIKNLFREVDRRNGNSGSTLLSLTRSRGILPQAEASKRIASVEDLSKYKLCKPGDLVMNRMQAWSGMFAVSTYEGCISPDYSLFLPVKPVEVKYFEHLFKTPLLVEQFAQRSKGIGTGFNRLYTPDFGVVPLALPPLEEQAQIATFLDYADRRIRRYIRSKQKLIKLLDEQKQVVINQAVTRGLNPNVPLKPSGIEWLGDIPEHWEVVKLGRLINLKTGFPFKSDGFSEDENDIRLLRGINITPGCLRWNDVVRWPRSEYSLFQEFDLRLDDLVLGMDRPIISSGLRVSLVTENDIPSLLLQRVARIRPLRELHTQFAYLILRGKIFSNYLAPIFTGISVPHISPEQIAGFRIALPTVQEQTSIVQEVERLTTGLNVAIEKANQEISLLHEFRIRLIADVVTGKLDVREAAAHLPAELNEPEPLEDDLPAELDLDADSDLEATAEDEAA